MQPAHQGQHGTILPFGVASRAQTAHTLLARDSYFVAYRGRLAWLDDGQERTRPTAPQPSYLLALASGESHDPIAAAEIASIVMRLMVRLYESGHPTHPIQTVTQYIQKAHARIASRLQAYTPRHASMALLWGHLGTMTWVEIGDCRVRLYREQNLLRLGQPWPQGRSQRFVGPDVDHHAHGKLTFREGLNIGQVQIEPRDRFILMSNTVQDAVDPASLSSLLQHISDPQTASASCLDKAVARGARGALTAIVVDPPTTTINRDGVPLRQKPPVRLRSVQTAPTFP